MKPLDVHEADGYAAEMSKYWVRRLRALTFDALLRFMATPGLQAKRVGKNRRFSDSAKNAVRGLIFTFVSERNFRIEVVAATVAIIAGFTLHLDNIEWALVLMSCFLVLALEAKNTSLELSVDIATQEYDWDAKGSKDASSGAVLLSSVSALLVGILVFGPKMLALCARIWS